MVLGSRWDLVRTYFVYLDPPLIALVVFVVVFFLLQIAGVLAPGWPPRRAQRGSQEPTSPPSP
jgi:hypothetical protein